MENYFENNKSDLYGKEGIDVEYSQYNVGSFKEAVNSIEEESNGINSFCIVDIDGTMIANKITQYPGLCYLQKPRIGGDVMETFPTLVDTFKYGNLCIATNRHEGVSFPWSSKGMMNIVDNYLDQFGFKIPSFTRQNKQLSATKIGLSKRIELSNYIIDYVVRNNVKNRLYIHSIQDLLPVSFKIDTFPKQIGRMVVEDVREILNRDILVEINDYVIHK